MTRLASTPAANIIEIPSAAQVLAWTMGCMTLSVVLHVLVG